MHTHMHAHAYTHIGIHLVGSDCACPLAGRGDYTCVRACACAQGNAVTYAHTYISPAYGTGGHLWPASEAALLWRALPALAPGGGGGD